MLRGTNMKFWANQEGWWHKKAKALLTPVFPVVNQCYWPSGLDVKLHPLGLVILNYILIDHTSCLISPDGWSCVAVGLPSLEADPEDDPEVSWGVVDVTITVSTSWLWELDTDGFEHWRGVEAWQCVDNCCVACMLTLLWTLKRVILMYYTTWENVVFIENAAVSIPVA